MNKQNILTVIILNCIVATSFASTVYQFDRGAIAKHAEQELRAVFEPLKQKATTQNFLEKNNNTLIVEITDAVYSKHYQTPFKTQADAKEYATLLAKLFGADTIGRLAKKQAAQELKNEPSLFNKKAVKQEVRKKIRRQALMSLLTSGKLTPVLQTMQEEISATITARINQHRQELHNWNRL